MRLDINLATTPYEDSRQFWMRWGTGLAAAAIVTLVLVTLTITGWLSARRDHIQIADLHRQIQLRDDMRQDDERFLDQPENRTTRDESQFLNQLIERKAFSWTQVLGDLEKVMPAGVHLVSIHPELDENNQLGLKMVVAGGSRDRALELARRMEDSKRFAQTSIDSETGRSSGGGLDNVSFDINATYIPQEIRVAPAAATPKTNAPPSSVPAAKTGAPKPAVPMTGISKPPVSQAKPNAFKRSKP